MAFGDVYEFRSSQAIGHASRKKLHVHISKADYGRDFKIRRRPHHLFLTEDFSYVSLGTTIEEPTIEPDRKVGALHEGVYRKLYAHASSNTFLIDFRREVLKALHDATTRLQTRAMQRKT